MRTYGVREFTPNGASADDLIREELNLLGYSIVPNVLDVSTLNDSRERLDAVYAKQILEIRERDLRAINEVDIVRLPLSYDDHFIELAANERVLSLVRSLLGENVVLMTQNGILNRPNEESVQASWHRDLNYQHFVSTRPLAISALYCLDDFSSLTGGTELIPVSHRIERFPSPEYTAEHSIICTATAGSVLLFDSMVFHRTGQNMGTAIRRALNHVYTVPMIQQQLSIPDALPEAPSDPHLQTLLGFTFQPARSVDSWRQQRLVRD